MKRRKMAAVQDLDHLPRSYLFFFVNGIILVIWDIVIGNAALDRLDLYLELHDSLIQNTVDLSNGGKVTIALDEHLC